MSKQLGTYDDGKKEAGQSIEYTQEQIIELAKCAEDFIYFTKYCKIDTDKPTNPDYTADLRDYQLEMTDLFINNRFSIILSSRQSGKCYAADTEIILRHKVTGIIETVKAGEFFAMLMTCNE